MILIYTVRNFKGQNFVEIKEGFNTYIIDNCSGYVCIFQSLANLETKPGSKGMSSLFCAMQTLLVGQDKAWCVHRHQSWFLCVEHYQRLPMVFVSIYKLSCLQYQKN